MSVERPVPVEGHWDAVVLGAGISGLVSSSILLDQGCARVLVVDVYPQVGGNHLDRTHGGYTFDVGSFIFQDDSPLLRHLPDLLPRYVPIDPTWGKLNPQGVVTEYPFSLRDDFLAAGPVECARMVLSAVWARLFRRELHSARDFARYWIGARLLRRSGLENYMERFCGLPADRIDLGFAQKRMMWISEHASVGRTLDLLRRRLRRPTQAAEPSPAPPANRQLARPREGFAHLYGPAVERLTESGATFALDTRTSDLRRSDGVFQLRVGEQPVTADRVISTIPIDEALKLCGAPARDRLPTVTLTSLFYSFSGARGFDQSILYNFAHDGSWKRLTVYSDFYGRTDDREYFAVETLGDRPETTAEELADDFRRHTARNRLFVGDLRWEGHHVLRNAYPIYTDRAEDRAAAAVAELRTYGVESFGRQGGFAYQPTARVSTRTAERALPPAERSDALPGAVPGGTPSDGAQRGETALSESAI